MTSLGSRDDVIRGVGATLHMACLRGCGEQNIQSSNYKYVIRKVQRGRVYWCAQPARGVQRLFDTQIGAAQCVARNLGTKVNKLVKGKGETHCLDYCNRFRVILDVYDHGREGPGDFESWRQMATDKFAKETFEREPASELLALLAKYGPFRVVFVQALSVRDPRIRCPRSNFSRSRVQSSHTRALKLWVALRTAAKKVAASTDLTIWIQNCGRNVSHHSGLISLLHRLDILIRAGQKQDGFQFRRGGHFYKLKETAVAKQKSLQKLQHIIAFMDDVSKSKVQGPRSCAEWCSATEQLRELAAKHDVPGMKATL